ncbi:hypothetical protein PT015_19310 [Candidatus Mycobacterium wuenschmannii]|uniref:Mce associated membrane protein n=1 Tax=Candidatus Mycobacterium wuenschmannii TaxID=3027808 RepID=A0ABY8VTQ3_9MYCO|nr:hypothetical protein [Candidatus Mycobacterium wuenschmannii]WIM87000.1 hypothetical protein PT015_19310 [Candidatus Mycobacterium wuenschmannii]
MPDEEQPEPTPDETAAVTTADEAPGRTFSPYGIASAVLGALCVAAVALGYVIWADHHNDVGERTYQTRAMQAAADWTGLLINMNTQNIKENLQKLHDGTVGELNADFDSSIQPYEQVVQRLQSQSRGEVEAVAFEAVHHDLDAQPGDPKPPAGLPASIARRTDTVMVVATSVSENSGGKPTTVHWNLRLGVSDIDGKLMISRLESIR